MQTSCPPGEVKLNSYGGAVCVLPARLTPVSTHFLQQEYYLQQATCGTLGIMLNFDATQHFAAERNKLYMKPPQHSQGFCFAPAAPVQNMKRPPAFLFVCFTSGVQFLLEDR